MNFLLLVGFLSLSQVLVEAKDDVTTEKQTLSTKATSCNVNNYNSFYAGPNKKVESLLVDVKRQLDAIQTQLEYLTMKEHNDTKVYGTNCADLYKAAKRMNGVYTIDPDGSGPFKVFCDQTTDGGGWTVFQKRLDGSVDFFREWNDYKRGFGKLNGEFWLGLDHINRLTNSGRIELRVDLEDVEGNTAYAKYAMFSVSSERTKYRLSVGSYSGTAGDALTSEHLGMPFSTKDQDNDNDSTSCAKNYKGAWWYNDCHHSNLNGAYHHGKHSSYADGVIWYQWKGYNYSVKRAEMKIRPVGF